MHTLTRRDFTRAVALAGAALAIPGHARAMLRQGQPGATVFDWSPLAGGRAHLCAGQGGNALVVPSAGEALLIDCKNAGFGHALKHEAEKQGAPLRLVVNTHHHADHTGGNYAFAGAIDLLAHRNAEPRIIDDAQFKRFVNACAGAGENARKNAPADARAQALLDATPEGFFASGYARLEASDWGPTLLMDDEREARIGDAVAEVRHIGPGHTDNDVFVHLPQLNVVHTGDLCFHRLHPFIDRPAGATVRGWIRSCEAMLALCADDTVVVPGHGEVGGPGVIRGQIEYFQRTIEGVQQAIDDGLERDAVTKLTFDHFQGVGFEQLKERVLGAVYDELTGAPAS